MTQPSWNADAIESLDGYLRTLSGDALRTQLQQIESLVPDRLTIPFSPHAPHPRQWVFLHQNDVREVLFGGAAGGGKTDALLMAASQYVDQPGYTAILMRLTLAEAKGADAIGTRAHDWWGHIAEWNGEAQTFYFPSGATISLGYARNRKDCLRYRGPRYQFIGWDELTAFPQEVYEFMFTRLGKLTGMKVPLRVRATTNPGGPGHVWVKERFITEDAVTDMLAGRHGRIYMKQQGKQRRLFVPSLLADNPSLDEETYVESMEYTDPVTRAQMLRGDWIAAPDGKFRRAWLRYFKPAANGLGWECQLGDDRWIYVPRDECMILITIDSAASSAEQEASDRTGHGSHSVISTWAFHPQLGILLWIGQRRGQWSFPDLRRNLEDEFRIEQPAFVAIENATWGKALAQEVSYMPLRLLNPVTDKLTRATRALNMASEGKIFLPSLAPWTSDTVTELVTWRGRKDEQTDRIDTLSYAAIEAYQPPLAVYRI